jgi:SAM-dependent methyltransferase
VSDGALPGPNPTPLDEAGLRRLHRRAITDPREIRGLLIRAGTSGVVLRSGIDRRNEPRTARVVRVLPESLGMRGSGLPTNTPQLHFTFELEGRAFFFACERRSGGGRGRIEADLPSAIYEVERRDLRRVTAGTASAPRRVELIPRAGRSRVADVLDWSYHGLGVSLRAEDAGDLGGELRFRYLDGASAGEESHARVRHHRGVDDCPGWVRLGLSLSKAPEGSRVAVQSKRNILPIGVAGRLLRSATLAAAPARVGSVRLAERLGVSQRSAELEVVEYESDRGEPIVGLLDRAGDPRGATAVLIPPSWGRTKEAFLPLARTIVRSFETSGEPVAVLRFDGTHRRGESYIEPRFRAPSAEYLGFTFSQAVRDIHASIDFLTREIGASRIVLVTFSLGSVEGRRALAEHAGGRVAGWISVVGMVDLQSGLRAVSGGVDYAYGLLEGVSFGRHELVGVLADMDLTGHDAIRHRMVFLEDARQDMAAIRVPVVWIHGRHDAWMDLDRVVTLLSAGDSSKRRLIVIPTGHQLRSSREALETFQLVATEVGRVALGRELKPALPLFADLERRRSAELARRPAPHFDARTFWREYLLGREGAGGFELLAATSAYRALMRAQIASLSLDAGDCVVDLGSGTGELALALSANGAPARLRVVEVDLVAEALSRASRRHTSANGSVRVARVSADLELRRSSLPLARGTADAVLASLLVSYLERPEALLREAYALLRAGGRLVLSALRRDADISKIYVEGLAELHPERLERLFGPEVARRFDALQRDLLNSASRLFELEERGRFRFFEGPELVEMVSAAGFRGIELSRAFGDPPQALVVSARKDPPR